MLNDIRNYIIITLFIVVVILFLGYKNASENAEKYKNTNKVLQSAIDEQNKAIGDLKYDAEEGQLRIKELESKWAKRTKEIKKESDAIMKYTVPKDCEQAIKWGNLEAMKLNLHE